ncbi:hypothetical protein [Ectobacillus ponti]|uniref:TFIIS-type domain-containing protein n=1 Tax=Ectobacillus ponti TaxID=2961894 RepID=A0AA42BR26_9BACI|nr:hypothetical protein [Ectobacillus ponti]MCP8970885.1 hypothetical protein [Ectobacillus ponti]
MQMGMPDVVCPQCKQAAEMEDVLTAQANQNVIYTCPSCGYMLRNIKTSKG